MVHLILTGATGLVGSAVLSHILSLPASATPQITRLSILSRNPNIALLARPHPPPGTPNANKHTKIEVIEHKDFGTFPPELLERLKGADACIWSLGVSQNDVDRETYVRITRDFAVNAAKAFSTLKQSSSTPSLQSLQSSQPQSTHNTAGTGTGGRTKDATEALQGKEGEGEHGKFKFIYVSGEGATQTPSRLTPLYGRVKGETETALLELARQPDMRRKLSVYSVRPAAVDGTNQPWLWKEILKHHRTAFQSFYLRALIGPIRHLGKASWVSPTEDLGRVLVDMALDDSKGMGGGEGEEEQGGGYEMYGPDGLSGDGGRILDNVVLRRLGREGETR
ncbi:hypothetical protein PV05_09741 [Exophiala xenobiotica]|uniref:NAD(P)-binding domain-containing protein n=1 Tax=Exophiala xenobiotica TaxID=348802 RepID=A0A0D2ET34_9EURO|nr:uncharacterized protein PV05_09741 [Exophiala xenobiotica]KIW50969.1 hypothetical protein PV05_09741 [Exophiala xenobiotica]